MIDELDHYPGVPQHLFEGLKVYVLHGIPTGGFLQCCLENKLVEAVMHADPHSLQAIPAIASLLYNHFPARVHGCWGSAEAVDTWLERCRALRRAEKDKS